MRARLARVRALVILGLASALACAGCTSTPVWGQRAQAFPSWQRIRCAAITAATDPHTWAPLAGAAVLQIGDADREIADWAREHTPIFGSNRTAEDVSDVLLDASRVGWGVSLAFTPSGKQLGPALGHKAKGLAVELVALEAQRHAIQGLKRATNRLRPDGKDRRSFPSAHNGAVSSFGALTRRHADAMPLRPHERRLIYATTTAASITTGWARVEAGRHFPADSLAAWGLGNFLSVFLHDAFLGRTCLRVHTAPNAIGLGLAHDF